VLDETSGERWIFDDIFQPKFTFVKFLYSDGSIGGESFLQDFEYIIKICLTKLNPVF